MRTHPPKQGLKAPLAVRVKAARLFRAGASDAAVGDACGYSKAWACKLRKRIESGLESEAIAEALTTKPDVDPPRPEKVERRAPSPADPPPGEVDISVKAQLHRTIAQAQKTVRLQDEASKDGNSSAAQKYGRDLVELNKVISRLQKDSRDEVDGVLLNAETIAAADLELESLITRLAQWGGPHCARCGRELRIAAAEKDTDPTEPKT